MYFIDPHVHMVSRTTDDYEIMARMGCTAISEPAFWAGYDRGSVEGFRDYWIAQPGQKGVKTDWTATWRNWVRRQQQAKKTASEARLTQMAALTRGLATPKPAPAPFWAKPEQTVEVSDVERKRLL